MKKFTFLLAALIVSVSSVMAETVAYTLTPIVGKNTGYASNEDVTVGDIKWNVTGNVSVNPWRLGGKQISNQDRALYSKTAIAKNISKIEVTHDAGTITVNSMKLIVSATANGTGEELTGTYTSAGTTTFTRPTDSDWTGKYYKIVYNVTNSTKTNKYVAFSEAKFYTDETAAVLQPVFTPEEGKVTDGSFTESFTLTMSCETADATIYYTLDGTNPAEETALTYSTPITIPATSTKVRAIAKKGADESFETEQVYAFINSPATAYTVTEAKAVIDKALGLDYELYGKGTIKSIKGYYDSKYITYTITDGTNDLTVYNGLGLEKAAFAAATDLSIGDQVVICGKLVKFSGTYEFNKDNYLISLTPAPKYTITALVNDEKMGTVSGAGEYKVSTEATLTATANTGYEFVNWTDADNKEVSTDAKYTFTVTAAATYTANFAAKTFEVLTDVNDKTMGSVEGTPTAKVAYGIEITLTAKPNTGYEFVNWTDVYDKVVSTDAAYTFTVTEEVALIANFKEIKPATWYGQEPLTGTLSGVNYSIVYEITRNIEKTLTFKLALNDEAAAVENLKITVVINNKEEGYITENFTSGEFTTSGYYTDGDELNIQFYLGCNAGGVFTNTIKYTVGSSNDKPTAINAVSTGAKATKRIENGVLIIEKNGIRYNAQGVVVE